MSNHILSERVLNIFNVWSLRHVQSDTMNQIVHLQHHWVDALGFLMLFVAGAGHGDTVVELGAAAPPAAFGWVVLGLATKVHVLFAVPECLPTTPT